MRPINDLTHPDVEWTWDSVHDKAFEEIKRLLTQAPVLAYFDSTKELSIQCDASEQGLGAALLQEGRPLAHASRALSYTETRYATIEKEMLAIVFALEKWHQFTYGRHVTIHSDHKPLESITKKPLDRAPKRLQGMLVRALAYNIDVQYLNGKEMFLADTLSRAYLPLTCHDTQEEFEIINAPTYLVMSDKRIQATRQHTNCDPALQQLKLCKEPLMSHDIPERAWEKIGCELLSCNGKDYLITACYKSNFWELDRLTDTKSTTLIKKLKAHLARYGIPRQLVSDNGPKFVSSEFHAFTKSWGIQHLVKTSQPSKQQDLAKEPHPMPSADCKVTTPGQDTQHNASPQNQAEGTSDTTTMPNPCESGAAKRSRSGRAIKPPARLRD
ncbi:Retrovirus-related Pol polyprotein from transposon 17.6 [Stylophora pistillata]|uniref:Retrovirus-related Pol polyprotein from transposon 17.6 n=1 Tax=Stylophora pistillata TaxID=50429 RepID=A0A2B4SVC2_STYPI|nr:Retrovirus-related Pol polyprotein from transposon 17.6 [Stylophora pistillata]